MAVPTRQPRLSEPGERSPLLPTLLEAQYVAEELSNAEECRRYGSNRRLARISSVVLLVVEVAALVVAGCLLVSATLSVVDRFRLPNERSIEESNQAASLIGDPLERWDVWKAAAAQFWQPTASWDTLEQQASEDLEKTREWTSSTAEKSKEWASHAYQDTSSALQNTHLPEKWQGIEESSQQWAQKTKDSTKEALNRIEWAQIADSTSEWFQSVWNASAESAHKMWLRMHQGGKWASKHERVWWNKTVDTERDWYNHSLSQMHIFGQHVQKWWNTTSGKAGQEEHVLADNFQHWWSTASDKERQWWNDTQIAFGRFEQNAEEKEKLWWDMTKHTVVSDWNATKVTEHRWWNATETWFEKQSASGMDFADLTRPLVYLNTTRAYQLVMSYYGWFDQSSDFFLYQQGWDAQINQGYCGVASAAALMNSVRGSGIELPIDPIYAPHPYATQHSLLDNDCVNRHVIRYKADYDGIFHFPGGLNLNQVAGLLECNLPKHGWNVTAVPVDDTVSVVQMRNDLEAALHNPFARVVVNFDRAVLGQDGHGHFSPIAGYSSSTDSFLMMDVAKYKYPPAWVPAARLHAAMHTSDACGDWDFPSAQYRFGNLTYPNSTHDFVKALKAFDCKPTFRGYVIVESE